MDDLFKSYAAQVTQLSNSSTTIEATYYPALVELVSRILRDRKLPFQVRATTSERRSSGGRDQPDIALYDGSGDFVVVCCEVKEPGKDLAEIAFSTERNDQIGRYLAQTGVVLLSNVRGFGLLTAKPDASRKAAIPASDRHLEETAELWPSSTSLRRGDPLLSDGPASVGDLIELAVTHYAPIAEPESLARILARQARRAKFQLPSKFSEAVLTLREDFGAALGITFAGEEGEEFFRSSLIQTVYYAVFAAWLLWLHQGGSRQAGPFNWERVHEFLKIPFLGELFHEMKHPTRIRELGLRDHLEIATRALARVDESAFQGRLTGPSLTSEETDTPVAYAAIMYFYEPFLEAFDPDLRKELGVWYTPPEIVRYQVRRVDAILRNELSCSRGFADENVVVLDPCCGTGAYLVEILRLVAQQLRADGAGALLGEHLLRAVRTRIVGFEILTAPFVVAHLQMYLILSALDVQPQAGQRPAIFLTNALTGWRGPEQLKLHFPELQEEHDAARSIKTRARIIVVMGNPPYNRFGGVPIEEEADLVDRYKGIHRNSQGKQVGQTDLYVIWGVRKHLLDDFYIRFFRLAEECIGDRADYGVVSFISNNSYLNGRSHPMMRESLLSSFHTLWIDNLHGNRLASERTPWGDSCETIFNVAGVGAGIKVGTAISTLLKKRSVRTSPENTVVLARDFWGRAAAKRGALLQSLLLDRLPQTQRAALKELAEGPRDYVTLSPSRENGWQLSRAGGSVGYEDWIALDELFPIAIQGINPNRGLSESVIDFDSDKLADRMRLYFSDASDEEFSRLHPVLYEKRARYDPQRVRRKLQQVGFDARKLVPYLLFPLDLRWLYYETAGKLLNEARADLDSCLSTNEFLIVVPQPRRPSETRPLICRSAFDLHVHDRGAVGFPAHTPSEPGLFAHRAKASSLQKPNLSDKALSAFSRIWGDHCERATIVGRLFRFCVAICHSPQYEIDNRDDLAQDWARVPLPRGWRIFEELVDAGELVSQLLDPAADPESAIMALLGPEARSMARIESTSGKTIRESDLTVEYAYFGAARGRWEGRPFAADEVSRPEFGEQTGDLFLNKEVRLRNVPARVWAYEIGGYPVLKKWLGYRDNRRRPSTTLTLGEIEYFRKMVQRIAALLVLHPRLDHLYELSLAESVSRNEVFDLMAVG